MGMDDIESFPARHSPESGGLGQHKDRRQHIRKQAQPFIAAHGLSVPHNGQRVRAYVTKMVHLDRTLNWADTGMEWGEDVNLVA